MQYFSNASPGLTVRFLRVNIEVFWKKESRPIERRQCRLSTRQLCFCLHIYSPWNFHRAWVQLVNILKIKAGNFHRFCCWVKKKKKGLKLFDFWEWPVKRIFACNNDWLRASQVHLWRFEDLSSGKTEFEMVWLPIIFLRVSIPSVLAVAVFVSSLALVTLSSSIEQQNPDQSFRSGTQHIPGAHCHTQVCSHVPTVLTSMSGSSESSLFLVLRLWLRLPRGLFGGQQ